jgi:NitT/TauT family transport system substrate-binding protein
MPTFVRVIAALAVFAILAIRPTPAQSPALTPVRVGVLPNGDMIALLYGVRSGMFAKAGLDVQIDRSSPNGSTVAAAVSSGAYDIGKGSLTAIMDAHLRGVPFTVIGSAAVYESKSPYVGMIVPKDSPIHQVSDFKSGVVGVNFLHDLSELALDKALGDAGGSTKDLQYTEIPMTAVLPAVESHRVLAAVASDPLLSQALDSGKVRLIPIYNTFGSSFSFSIFFTTKDYAAKHVAAIKAFTRVLAESARYTNTHRDELAPMLSDFSGIPLTVLTHMPWVTNGTGVDTASIQMLIDTAAKYKFISRRFSALEIIDPDVLERN